MASGSGGDPPSIISRDAIKVISESVGIADLKDEQQQEKEDLLHAVRERLQPAPYLRLLLDVLVHSNDERADGRRRAHGEQRKRPAAAQERAAAAKNAS